MRELVWIWIKEKPEVTILKVTSTIIDMRLKKLSEMIDSLFRLLHRLYGVYKHEYNNLEMHLQFRKFFNFWFEASTSWGLERWLRD